MLTAVNDFDRMDFEGILAGVEMVNSIIHVIPNDIKDCDIMSSDIAKLERWAKIFGHPITLAEHLINNLYLHFADVYADATEAMASWN